jgi:hypothetical protein
VNTTTIKTGVSWSHGLFAVVALWLMLSPSDARSQTATTELFTQGQLEELVGPIALYPDNLLSVFLDAAGYPLQLVQAERFLDDFENDSELNPDESWDESVVALLNYPELVELLNEDLDWTETLGYAFIDQQTELFDAVQNFRKRAYAAGNLKSDEYQKVVLDGFIIKIEPAEPDVIYIPDYEPARVVVYQTYPAYSYYPYGYPVYYYPYPARHSFGSGFFWGVSTVLSINWLDRGFYSFGYNYYGHPYYGRDYYHQNHYYHQSHQRTGYGGKHVRHDRRHARRYKQHFAGRAKNSDQRRMGHRRYRNVDSHGSRSTQRRQHDSATRHDRRAHRTTNNRTDQRSDSRQTDAQARNSSANRDPRVDNRRRNGRQNGINTDSRRNNGGEDVQRSTKRNTTAQTEQRRTDGRRSKEQRQAVKENNRRTMAQTTPRSTAQNKTLKQRSARKTVRTGSVNTKQRSVKRKPVINKTVKRSGQTRQVQRKIVNKTKPAQRPAQQNRQRTKVAQRSKPKARNNGGQRSASNDRSSSRDSSTNSRRVR